MRGLVPETSPCNYIPANSHTLGVSVTPAGWKLRSNAGSRLRANFSRLIENVSCCCLAWHNFQKYVNSDPCKERKPCVKWTNDNTFPAISDFSREKHWERAHVYTRGKTSEDFGSLQTSTEDFGLLRESSKMVVSCSKIPGTARIKISSLYRSQKTLAGIQLVSWRVYMRGLVADWTKVISCH